jgi:hypothetical protein
MASTGETDASTIPITVEFSYVYPTESLPYNIVLCFAAHQHSKKCSFRTLHTYIYIHNPHH